ncbi:MAG: tetratricopeptide repeat protein [Nitrospirae bacterium]|nr:tetratricopeptide repeat protein [Nitrospirota bacterium]
MPNKEGGQSLELQKLAEKFRKDPTSKLFYPLAEEYLKIGLVDDAIPLLRAGIRSHPGLLSARVALGKALQSQGLEAEARAEFEQVITANPDNIMAHKRLASIYLKAGEKLNALTSCQAVLAIHPSDPEILKIKDEAERLPDPSPQAVSAEGSAAEDSSAEVDAIESEPTVIGPTVSDAFDVEPTVVDAAGAEPTVVGPALIDSFDVEPTVVDAVWTEPTVVGPAPVSEGSSQSSGANPIGDLSFEEDAVEAETGADLPVDDLATISLADLYVAQGHYQQGIEIYRRVLDRFPGHADAMAKLENALTLDRLLTSQRSGGDALKREVVQRVVGGFDEAPRDEIQAEAVESEPSLVGASVKRSKHVATIERLEAWLARIAERRRT